jgi:hypothetical protein
MERLFSQADGVPLVGSAKAGAGRRLGSDAPRFQAALGVFISIVGGQVELDSKWADSDSAHVGRAGQVPMEETRNSMFLNPKSLLIIVACICFAIAVLTAAKVLSIGSKIDWTDLGLFFGFLSFIL